MKKYENENRNVVSVICSLKCEWICKKEHTENNRKGLILKIRNSASCYFRSAGSNC